MPFRNGTVAYAQFRVTGGPSQVEQDLLDALGSSVINETPIGTPPEIQAGWVAGRHVYDMTFDEETIVFGNRLLFGLRIDTNRVPAEIRRAYRLMAMQARTGTGNEARREVDEEIDDRCRQELAAGRHRRSRMMPVLWNVARHTVLAPCFSDAGMKVLCDHFESTFDATLEPVSAGSIAGLRLSTAGRSRDYEDLAPSIFTAPPPAAHADSGDGAPPVPWSRLGPQPKDFLGNEFLIWLWSQSEIGTAAIDTTGGPVALVLDKSLDMDCAWEATGKQMLRATGPTRLPEAAKALQGGKWPRKAGFAMAARGDQWILTFQADRFVVSGCKLTAPDDPPNSEHDRTEQRLDSIETLNDVLNDLFAAFLDRRCESSWSGERSSIRDWIARRGGAGARETTAPVMQEV